MPTSSDSPLALALGTKTDTGDREVADVDGNRAWVIPPAFIEGAGEITLGPGSSYHVEPATDIVLPLAQRYQQPIYLSRDWAAVDAAATIALQGADQLVRSFPSTGSEVVQLWSDPDGLIDGVAGWVILSTASIILTAVQAGDETIQAGDETVLAGTAN